MSGLLLEVKNLKSYFYTYDGVVRAVDGVSFYVKEGESFGLVGETGCGKSVTALSVMRLLDPPGEILDGEILFEGRDLLKLSEDEMQKLRGNKISMIFQDPMASLNPLMKVGEQIAEVLKGEGNGEREKIVELLKLVRMPSPERVVNSYPFELSGGMRQRVMIAMMVASNPRLLIADEPTTALDVTTQAQILNLLKEMKDKLGLSIWLITHDLGVVAEFCDRVCVMYAGKVVECGSIKEIFKNPLHPYTQGLLASLPTIERKVDKLRSIPGTVPDLINPPSGCRFHPRCDKAFAPCFDVPPEEVKVSESHRVFCHLYL
ncbi:MAG: ABC transporter ATP-binding protein [Synergistetes bacterium]|nr:MAG: Oligopeptide/dipeptide ABC transporter, ATPase subunit [bacterium 42_11]MBC7332012.1 ABC transporter ATP-binding protein [Synergistota bacterium]MDK2871792.1 peptide/nickel transport system ATP-binding protein [bacterium]